MRASERAYLALLEEILEWRLPPGTILAEVEQSERLGVSRTPLREALGRLAAEGLTAAHNGRGVVVTELSLDHADELFELREALECKAASLAARRGNPLVFSELQKEFSSAAALVQGDDAAKGNYYSLVQRLDDAIDQAMNNAYLLQSLKSLRVHLVRMRRLAKDNPERLLASAMEHANIAGAIAAGDAQLAAACTTVHLNQSLNHLKSTQHQTERTAS
ncbi:GntR family transcriptional regulator [Arthrobacter sp. ISL-85]|uniref:GntR family transcriptional regulator n=1 Tax=Arthrobacter sp. ISL-85 TaxID=2819115 RepID=UPI001BEA87B2|nr:GntR family transcriptional regulator [Arthrobacter sp. ISL-85]MBT2565226.1 GntR family transcriptional regulator [Arthrobacter sp. ISL-85]